MESVLELLEDYGEIPQCVKNRLYATKDADTLKRWHKLAARVASIEEFEANY
ncbi:MAG: hypothetical protein Q4C58_14700 [Eubacteriales bacterium]|nr:hypothetical protein [Eubacteriales bacterium]